MRLGPPGPGRIDVVPCPIPLTWGVVSVLTLLGITWAWPFEMKEGTWWVDEGAARVREIAPRENTLKITKQIKSGATIRNARDER